MRRRPIRFTILLVALGGYLVAAAETDGAAPVDYSRQIQPILAKRCYQCHGPSVAEGGLRLTSRDAAMAELESGSQAVVPGDLAASVMLERVRTDDEHSRMPPEGPSLAENEIALIEAWIEQEAPWTEHWAFRQGDAPPVPAVREDNWVRNPIDAFVLRRLEHEQLAPARTASKVTLIRRAYYDLIGLPPTPSQVQDFLADDSAIAFEKVIDHLLESPQYGEKWARHWLDVVRYAETNGYERDGTKDLIWKYRDYLIRAFNDDTPFDQFILQQLAGDELPEPDAQSVTATGFYRLGLWDDEPADRQLARYDYLDDILRTTSEAFLAMTIGCARCHDHKIDPVTQRDYYSMLAFFADISPHGKAGANHVSITTPAEREAFDQTRAAKRARERDMQDQLAEIELDFLARLKAAHPDLEIQDPNDGATSTLLPISTNGGQFWEYTFEKPADDWIEIAFDDSQWRSGEGGFGTPKTPGASVRTTWRTADIWLRRDFRLAAIPSTLTLDIHHDEDAEVYLNGKRVASFKGYQKRYQKVDVTAAVSDVLQTGRNTLAVHCHQTGGGQYIDAGLSIDGTSVSALAQEYGPEVVGEQRLAAWRQLQEQLAESRSQSLELTETYVMAVAERGRQPTFVLGRGNPRATGDEVQPAFPQTLDPPQVQLPTRNDTAATSGRRLALARWIASADNPVSARVAVNRIWQHHFGRGIVRTSSDFGFQGTAPTHPELLDWLAAEFVAGGWRMKPFHKLIMMSQTYQMSSADNPSARLQDPANDYFWRFNARRLTAEEIRDSMLAVSGTLNLQMYGPSVFPPLPAEVLATASRPDAAWGKSSPEDAARRSIYVHVKRSLRHPMLAGFDAPDSDTSCAVRVTTTVPTQALEMLNSPFMTAQSDRFATRLRAEARQDKRAQVRLAIQLTTARQPTSEEIESDLRFMNQLVEQQGLTQDAALQKYCLVLLNANEFFYVD